MPSIQTVNLNDHNDKKTITSKNVVLFLLATSIISNMIVILSHAMHHREISSSLALTLLCISSATTGFFLLGWVILDYFMNRGKGADVEDDEQKMLKTPSAVISRGYGSVSSRVVENNVNNDVYPTAKVVLSPYL
jgi:hypothetical protein